MTPPDNNRMREAALKLIADYKAKLASLEAKEAELS